MRKRQYVLLLSLFAASCTFVEKDVTLTPIVSTKSFMDNQYALSEKEAATKAEQFLLGIENSKQGESEVRSISAMNLSEKNAQIETIIRYIEYKQNEVNHYDLIPVYVINFVHNRSSEAGGYVVLTGDKRIKNNILVYSDTGFWDNENYAAQGFLFWFWTNVDEVIKNELEEMRSLPKIKSDPCDIAEEYTLTDNIILLSQLTKWHQCNPYNGKLSPSCNSALNSPYSTPYYLVGSIPVAMAQIMAHHRKPTSGSYVNYLGSTVSTIYSWSNMLSNPDANSLTSTYKEQVQNLMAEVNKRTLTPTGCLPPVTDFANVPSAFTAMGYALNPFALFQYSNLKTDINAGRPVLAFGNTLKSQIPLTWGWMMDGYNSILCDVTYIRYCPGQPPVVVGTDSSYLNYVHCNIGEDKSYIGYYFESVFTSSSNPTYIFTNIR